jgi:hypothetical protein
MPNLIENRYVTWDMNIEKKEGDDAAISCSLHVHLTNEGNENI